MPIPQLRPTKRHFRQGWKESSGSIKKHPWVEKISALKKRLFSKKGWRSYILPVAGGCIVLFGFFMIGAYAWIGRDLPNPDKIADRDIAESTKIYARDGETLLYEVHGEEKRTIIPLEDITSDLRWATIAVEDKNFYQHSGFDIPGLIRSIVRNIFTGSRVGGSTITQQLVKNSILSPEKTFTRKFKELILSYQIEHKFSKDEILQMYFNEIPYGSNAYGAEAAAQTFFGKSAKDVTLAQSALLAALPQLPSYYSPYGNHTDALVQRAHYVIDRMRDEGFISEENATKAKEEDILAQVLPRRDAIRAPHFVIWVREKLAEKYGEDTLERGGLRVITTLDAHMQDVAEQAIRDNVQRNEERYNATNAALVAVDPKTGQVLAMVGSRDYFDTENDGNVNVTLSVRNPGSSFKPMVYATAFSRGYTTETVLFDLVTNFGADGSGAAYIPKNYDLGERGPVTMRKALAGSLNIPAVKTLYLAGVQNVLDLAERAGYTTLGNRDQYGLALALGGGGVRLLDHAAAFAAFANEGQRHDVAPFLKVMDHKGEILEEYKEQETHEVVRKDVAHMITSVLSDNDARSYVFGSRNSLTLGGRPVAAKTGTTNDFIDAWTMGYTPSLAAGVWVGNNDNSKMNSGADGSIIAAPIWNAFMRGALEGTPVESFPSAPALPENLKPILRGSTSGSEPIAVDSVTGNRIPDSCRDSWPEAFVKTVEVNDAHTILYYVTKEDPRGDPPKNPASDSQFNAWEGPVRAWAEKNGYLATLPKEESCDLRTEDSKPVIRIQNPTINAAVPGDLIPVEASVSGSYTIKSVSVSVDNVVVDDARPKNKKKLTASFSIDATKLTSGFHTITVSASDIYDNTSSSDVRVHVVRDEEATVYFTNLQDSLSLSSADFPLSVSVYASAPDVIEKVELLYRTGSTDKIVATALAPTKNTVTLVWQTPPAQDGALFLKMTTDTIASQSDFIAVTVE